MFGVYFDSIWICIYILLFGTYSLLGVYEAMSIIHLWTFFYLIPYLHLVTCLLYSLG
jgi:hypothetical protein